MRAEDVFVCAAPHTTAALLACRALQPQRAGVAGCALAPIVHHDVLTPPTPHRRFASHPRERLSRWTTIGLELGLPLALRLGAKRGRRGRTHVVGLPGAVPGHPLLGTQGSVDSRPRAAIGQHLLQAAARQLCEALQHGR
jgi:hypothetical protein